MNIIIRYGNRLFWKQSVNPNPVTHLLEQNKTGRGHRCSGWASHYCNAHRIKVKIFIKEAEGWNDRVFAVNMLRHQRLFHIDYLGTQHNQLSLSVDNFQVALFCVTDLHKNPPNNIFSISDYDFPTIILFPT